jgi:DnaK suppressor protein
MAQHTCNAKTVEVIMAQTKAAVRRRLLSQREAILNELNRYKKDIKPDSHSRPSNELERIREESHDDHLTVSVIEIESAKLLTVDQALSDLEKGTYGICRDCGNDIGQARLRAMPSAIRCIACQEKAEAKSHEHAHSQSFSPFTQCPV